MQKEDNWFINPVLFDSNQRLVRLLAVGVPLLKYPLRRHEFQESALRRNFVSDKGFRSLTSMGQKVKKPEPGLVDVIFPFLQFKVVGLYDPNNIKVSKDPLNELPMETYRPSSADLVLDAKGEPVNPAKSIDTSGNPVGLLTSSPNILTTIDSARAVNGEQAISSIRLKIKGASTVSEESERLLQDVKKQIEQKTGLMVTITKGSSPQPVVTKVSMTGRRSAGLNNHGSTSVLR